MNSLPAAKRSLAPKELTANEVLGRLFVLQAQNRIPVRNAMALAYTAQVILSSLETVREEYRCVQGRGTHNEIIHTAISRACGVETEEDKEEAEADQQEEMKNDLEAQVDAAVKILEGQ